MIGVTDRDYLVDDDDSDDENDHSCNLIDQHLPPIPETRRLSDEVQRLRAKSKTDDDDYSCVEQSRRGSSTAITRKSPVQKAHDVLGGLRRLTVVEEGLDTEDDTDTDDEDDDIDVFGLERDGVNRQQEYWCFGVVPVLCKPLEPSFCPVTNKNRHTLLLKPNKVKKQNRSSSTATALTIDMEISEREDELEDEISSSSLKSL